MTFGHITLGRTLLDERSARRRDLHLTTRNITREKPSIPPTRFEPAIPASERPQTYAFDIATPGIGPFWHVFVCRNILVPLSEVCRRLNVFGLLWPWRWRKIPNRNVGYYLPVDTASQPTRLESSSVSLWQPKVVVVGHVVQLRSGGHCNEIREAGSY